MTPCSNPDIARRQCMRCFNGMTCALPAGHDGRCAFRNATLMDAYDEADRRRRAEAAKEPPAGYFKLWASRNKN